MKKSLVFYVYEFYTVKVWHIAVTRFFTNADFSHLSVHATGLGELDKQFRRDLEEWPRVEEWTLGIKAVLINIIYQEKYWSLFDYLRSLVLGMEEYFPLLQSISSLKHEKIELLGMEIRQMEVEEKTDNINHAR